MCQSPWDADRKAEQFLRARGRYTLVGTCTRESSQSERKPYQSCEALQEYSGSFSCETRCPSTVRLILSDQAATAPECHFDRFAVAGLRRSAQKMCPDLLQVVLQLIAALFTFSRRKISNVHLGKRLLLGPATAPTARMVRQPQDTASSQA